MLPLCHLSFHLSILFSSLSATATHAAVATEHAVIVVTASTIGQFVVEFSGAAAATLLNREDVWENLESKRCGNIGVHGFKIRHGVFKSIVDSCALISYVSNVSNETGDQYNVEHDICRLYWEKKKRSQRSASRTVLMHCS